MSIHRTSFIRRMAAMGMVNLLSSARGILLLPILSRWLGIVQYGIYSQFMVALQFLLPLATLGLENAVMRYLAGERRQEALREGFYSSLILSGGVATSLAGIWFLFKGEISPWVLGSGIESTLVDELAGWLFPLLIAYAGSLLVIAYFRTLEQFWWYASLSLLDAFLFLALALWWVAWGGGLMGVIWAMVLGRGLIALLGLGAIARKIRFEFPRFERMGIYLAYSLPLMPAAFFYYLIQFSDRYVLLYFRSLEEVARYNAAYTFGGIITLIFAPFFQLVTPRAMALWNEGRREEAGEFLSRAIKYGATPAILAIAGCGVFARKVMALCATREFAVSEAALAMVMTAYLLLMLQSFSRNVLMLANKTGQMLALDGGTVLFNLGLNFAFIPWLGLEGAALATLLTFALQYAVYTGWARRYLPYRQQGYFLLKAVAAAGIAVALMAEIGWRGPATALGLALGGTGVYLGLLFLARGFTCGEVRVFWQAFFKPR